MYNTLVIGMTGEGKTSVIKKNLEGKNVLVFDVNDEWHDCDFDTRKKRARFIGDHEDYLDLCLKRKNTNCVFEDATGFISANTTKAMNKVLVKKRHLKNNNIFFFHSINSVPPRMLEMCNFVYLFKTGDVEKVVEKKYPKLHNAFVKVQSLPRIEKKPNEPTIQPYVFLKLL